jgi:acetoin utilization deacetylase AcuC-like enzyme
MPTAYLSHPACLRHEMTPGHPESPERARSIEAQLQADGLFDLLQRHEAPRAGRAELERVHAADHVAAVFARAPQAGLVALDPDTYMGPGTLEAALRAAGAALLATELVLEGRAANAFCNVRPPGHHAERNAAMGFCFFNNVAVGAAHALAQGIERVAILDFDVHHGNGTEDVFRDEPRVLLCSSFQHPLYPFSYGPSAPGRLVNTPLRAGTDGAGFRAAVTEHWWPELERFAPEMIFVSAGFDAHAADPLAGLRLQDADYAWITARIVELAARHARGRIVSLLEGGYDIGAVARCASLHVRGLMDIS